MKVDLQKTFYFNEKVEIYILTGQSGAGTYRTTISDVTSEYIEIETPLKNGKFISLTPGTSLLLVQVKLDAIYTYQFRINSVNRDDLETFTVKAPEKVKRVQRRSFFRVEYPFKFEILPSCKRVNKNINKKKEEYLTHDVSGGGLAFYTYLKPGSIHFTMEEDYYIKLTINEIFYFFTAKIVRIQQLENQRVIIGLQIKEINKKSREEIIRALFIKQNELLQKGIL